MSPDATRAAHELQILEGMVDCAHELGMALGAAAKAERDTKRLLVLVEAYQKCFQGVRMGIRLCMTLRAPPKAAFEPQPIEAPERPEALDRERPERERLEREPLERERERDYEPVSLPKFLSTLGVVARDAGRLDLPPEAARLLPTLRDLLARANGDAPGSEPASSQAPRPASGVAVLARSPQGATRYRLMGSAAPPRPGPRAPPPSWSGSG
jgi:hypothetical protein